MSEPLIFTENAAKKVLELVEEDENPNLKLRVYVTGGGCSGFQYGFKFDEIVAEDDTIVTKAVENHNSDEDKDKDKDEGEGEKGGTVQLIVDPMSLQYLVGAEIDYKEDVEGAQFIIRNPNAKTTCGCGSSFSA